jgi:hypothetical protein
MDMWGGFASLASVRPSYGFDWRSLIEKEFPVVPHKQLQDAASE